jgi:hypothetical protein
MIIFTLFSISCTRWKEKRIETVPAKDYEGVLVVQAETNTGEVYEFPEEAPAIVREGQVKGKIRIVREEIILDKNDVRSVKLDSRGNILEYTTKDGKTYKVLSGRREHGQWIISSHSGDYGSVLIPLDEVKVMTELIQQIDLGHSALMVLGALAGVYLFGQIIFASPIISMF